MKFKNNRNTVLATGLVVFLAVLSACPMDMVGGIETMEPSTMPPSNTNAPVIEAQSITVRENHRGNLSEPIVATGENLIFRISENSDPALFDIDASTGQLRLAEGRSLDFETAPQVEDGRGYSIIVQVSDSSTPPRSAQARVTILLTDIDENNTPTITPQTRSIAENSAGGTALGVALTATDPNGDTISYSITTNSPATGVGLFSIDRASGVLSLASTAMLDFETAPQVEGGRGYSITVEVSDGASPTPNTAQAEITIMVTDLAEAPTLAPQTLSASEGLATGAVIGIVQAGNVDAGQTHTWEITTNAQSAGGDPLFRFADMNTGELSLDTGQTLDFETAPHIAGGRGYSITVQISDNETNMASVEITITVTNVLDTVVGNIVQTGTLEEGETITLNAEALTIEGTMPTGYIWSLASPEDTPAGFTIAEPSATTTAVTLPQWSAQVDVPGTFDLEFQLTLTSASGNATTSQTITVAAPADSDGDGLIDIRSLAMLNAMRHNLAGTGYTASTGATAVTTGCPEVAGTPTCTGYELVRNLNFDGDDADTTTWTDNGEGANPRYTLDADDPYYNSGDGWLPVGDNTNNFTGIFNGNGFSITGLAINLAGNDAGLFGVTNGAQIRNLRIEGALVMGRDGTGGLVGSTTNNTVIIASYATDSVIEGEDDVGGLVGSASSNSAIIASYSTASVSGDKNVGGLVGSATNNAVITASYAAGSVSGNDDIGGLVGFAATNAVITAGYSTGSVNGEDDVGGLVGTGSAATITASYATGSVTGRTTRDEVGNVIGTNTGSTITRSFGFGSAINSGFGNTNTEGTALPAGVTMASGLTLDLADDPATPTVNEWDSPSNNTLGAWRFRASDSPPAPPILNFADYDGAGTRFHCAGQSAGATTSVEIPNCSTPLPGQ